jgi:hypothetical protein
LLDFIVVMEFTLWLDGAMHCRAILREGWGHQQNGLQ